MEVNLCNEALRLLLGMTEAEPTHPAYEENKARCMDLALAHQLQHCKTEGDQRAAEAEVVRTAAMVEDAVRAGAIIVQARKVNVTVVTPLTDVVRSNN